MDLGVRLDDSVGPRVAFLDRRVHEPESKPDVQDVPALLVGDGDGVGLHQGRLPAHHHRLPLHTLVAGAFARALIRVYLGRIQLPAVQSSLPLAFSSISLSMVSS